MTYLLAYAWREREREKHSKYTVYRRLLYVGCVKHIYSCTYMYIHVHMKDLCISPSHIHRGMHAHTLTHTHMCIHAHTHRQTHSHIHSLTHSHIRTHTDSHTHTYIYVHVLATAVSCFWLAPFRRNSRDVVASSCQTISESVYERVHMCE